MIGRVPPLPHPFFAAAHHEYVREARRSWEPRLPAIAARHGSGEWDEDRTAREFVRALAEGGLLQRAIQGDVRTLCAAREECAFLSGFADSQLALQGLGSQPIALGGTPDQVQRWVRPAAEGTLIPAFALTEPEAGSDVRSLATCARRVDDHYVLDGGKVLITNAGVADYYTVFARLGDGDDTVALVVEKDTPGFQVSRRLQATAPHPLGELRFDQCRVPVACRIGAEGEGLSLAFGTLERFRPTVGAAALGLAMRALAEAREHTRSREQFGRPLARFQLLRATLADRWADAELARLAVLRAAWLLDRKDDANAADDDWARPLASSLGKLTGTEHAFRVVDTAVQMFGGRGVLQGEVVEALYRDVRALRIYEGTSEIQRLILAKGLLDGDEPD